MRGTPAICDPSLPSGVCVESETDGEAAHPSALEGEGETDGPAEGRPRSENLPGVLAARIKAQSKLRAAHQITLRPLCCIGDSPQVRSTLQRLDSPYPAIRSLLGAIEK